MNEKIVAISGLTNLSTGDGERTYARREILLDDEWHPFIEFCLERFSSHGRAQKRETWRIEITPRQLRHLLEELTGDH